MGGRHLSPPGSTGPAILHTIVIKMMKVLEKELRPNQTALCSIVVKRYVSKWHNEPELKFPTWLLRKLMKLKNYLHLSRNMESF